MKAPFRAPILCALAFFLWVALPSGAESASSPSGSTSSPKFGPNWAVLVGVWEAEADVSDGRGVCGFHFDLDEKIIVRTNLAERPGPGGQTGVHKDFMVIYPGAAENKARASYWDNEGHVIEYLAEWTDNGKTLTFLSQAGAGPQFRLTYQCLDQNTMTVLFEMAPPGSGGTFKKYTAGKIHRLRKDHG